MEDVPLSLAPMLLQTHDTGVSPTRTRRPFTAAYKLKILEAAAQCTKPGDLGALLRREGLYTSHLAAWRAAARRGKLAGLAQRRGPTPTPVDPHVKQDRDPRAAARPRHGARRTLGTHRGASKRVAQLLGLALPATGEPPEGSL